MYLKMAGRTMKITVLRYCGGDTSGHGTGAWQWSKKKKKKKIWVWCGGWGRSKKNTV